MEGVQTSGTRAPISSPREFRAALTHLTRVTTFTVGAQIWGTGVQEYPYFGRGRSPATDEDSGRVLFLAAHTPKDNGNHALEAWMVTDSPFDGIFYK